MWFILVLLFSVCSSLRIRLDTYDAGEASRGDMIYLKVEFHELSPRRALPTFEISHGGELIKYRVNAVENNVGTSSVIVGTDVSNEGNLAFLTVHNNEEGATYILVRHDSTHVQKMHLWKGTVRQITPRLPINRLPNEEHIVGETPTQRRTLCPSAKTTNVITGRTVVRVGILHTVEAKSLPFYGSSSVAIQMEVATAVAEGNVLAFPNSGIDIELQVCANELLDESVERQSSAETLRAFASSRRVEEVRVGNKCDLMVLFSTLQGLGNNACGVGYAPGKYSVVAADCFVDNYSFLHEIGHNLGACHGYPARAGGAGANAYGDAPHHFRTILAYREICEQGANCTRVPRFSNVISNYTWKGHATGNSNSDNAWIINANRHRAASNTC